MLIIGSEMKYMGPIGCELGQGFARLGSNVTMMITGNTFLSNEDADCSAYLTE